MLDLIPRLLRRVYPHTNRVIDERRGSARGRIDWARTLDLRTRTRDRSWFVGVSPRRSFETPELLLVRFMVERVVRTIADLSGEVLKAKAGWVADLAALRTSALRSRAHAALRDLPVVWPTPAQRSRCANSREPVVRAALRVLGHQDQLLPNPSQDALATTVSRFALSPLDINKRFELFALLSVMELLDHILDAFPREDALITPDRAQVATWQLPAGTVSLFYDQSPDPARHAEVIGHYFETTASVRPDIRLRFESNASARELYLDPKCSEEMTYLAHSHLKMQGYVADAPERFVDPGPKVVLITPREVKGEPRWWYDPVSYVSADDCSPGGRLHQLLLAWLEGARAHLTVPGPEKGMVAFMPWVSLEEPVELTGVRLLPFERGAGDQPEPVHVAVEAYRDGSGHPVRSAILCEVNGSTCGELDDTQRDRLFAVRDLLLFMGLRHRSFFGSVDPYWNADTFQLIVQRFVAGQGGSFAAPRSRGAQRGVFSTAEVHLVRAPTHVNTGQKLEVDAKLLAALDAASTGAEWEWLEPFLRKLSSANTDSSAVAEHAEMVDSVGALQQVVDKPAIHEERSIMEAFLDLMSHASPNARSLSDCARSAVTRRYQQAHSLRECWFKDFYRSRGSVAHGQATPPKAFAWSITEHLLLAAYLLPRLALVRLAKAGLYELSDNERDEIGAFDYLLCLPDLHEQKETDIPHRTKPAWNEALKNARWELHIARLAGKHDEDEAE
ncbi:MAG: hypothetical protein ACFCGT_27645 [Sandaracinaceae bacterium]